MNYTTNDRSETVIAIGAPGSVARAQCEWPALIEDLNTLYRQAILHTIQQPGRAIDTAVTLIRAAGVTSAMETSSILLASRYAEEPAGSVAALVVATGYTSERQEWARGYAERNAI